MAFQLKESAHVVTTWSTLVALAGVLWWSFGFTAQVQDNTHRIQAAEIRDVSQAIRYLEVESQKMDLYEVQNGVSAMSTQIKNGFRLDIKKLERKRTCLKADKPAHLCDED
jgi:hypothetical protein